MKKKLLSLLVACSFVLIGCGGGKDPTLDPTKLDPTPTQQVTPSGNPTPSSQTPTGQPSTPEVTPTPSSHTPTPSPSEDEYVVMTGLSISGKPNKVEYEEGDYFAPKGLKVLALFSDNSSRDVTSGVSWKPSPLTLGTTEVVGTYLGFTVTYSGITVNEKTIVVKTVKTYLVLTSIGLYEGKKGDNIEDLFLENTIVYEAEAGTDLPGADKVTSTSGALFSNWMEYIGGGSPTRVDKVPSGSGKILYANFVASDNPQPTPTDAETETYTFKVDCTTLLNWSPAASGFAIHAWGDKGGANEWGSAAEKMSAVGQGIYQIQIQYSGTLTGAIFYFTQSGATKQTVDINYDFEGGKTYKIEYDDHNWVNDKMSASIVEEQ